MSRLTQVDLLYELNCRSAVSDLVGCFALCTPFELTHETVGWYTHFPVPWISPLLLSCGGGDAAGVALSSGSALLLLTCQFTCSLHSSYCCLAVTPGSHTPSKHMLLKLVFAVAAMIVHIFVASQYSGL